MATVYLAIQESLDREVALKILDPNQAQGKQFSERFLREARIVSQLMHPNIVTVFDVGVHQGYHYLSMEYIDGRDLKQACTDLSRKELINIIKNVARALDYAAKKGYVHRDVKPENIMQHKTDGRVLLMDFGIARSYQTSHELTKAGSALGTPYYMSPEQNKGLNADHRSDIYSLGVVFFHMLSGYVPYDADSAVAIGIKHITAAIPILSDELQIFQPIINTCMAKDVDDRYQTAAEIIQALGKITDAELDAIEERSAAFHQAGKDHHAETMISSEANSIINTHDHRVSKAKPKRQERRSFWGFLLILVLLISGTLIYQQQQEIFTYTKDLNIPWLDKITEKLKPFIHQEITETRPAIIVSAKTPEPLAPTALSENNVTTIVNPQEELKLHYIDKIQSAIDSAEHTQALKLMAQMQEEIPELVNEPKFIQTQKQLQQAQRVTHHINQAQEYLKTKSINTNEKDNALSELNAALKLDPNNQQALKIIEDINYNWLNKAKQQPSWRLRKELQALDVFISQLDKQTPIILKQRTELQQAIQQTAKIMNLLDQADKNFKNSQLIIPENNSAYRYYHKVLAINPANQQARTKLKAIKVQLSKQITNALNEDRLTQANLFFEQALSIYGRQDWLANLEAKIEQAIEARRPKIDKIRFSASPLQSLEKIQTKTLQPGRTLFVGFHFKNMENAPTLLQAVLLDGAGRVQIAQKPVILSASEGNHFFQINLPVEGFSEGSYILSVRLKDKELVSQSFLVGNHN